LPAHVDHHDLVAETVHLDEGVIGERTHAEDPFTPPYMGKATLLASTSRDRFLDSAAWGGHKNRRAGP
jgi:hypothetical protein